MAPIHDNLFHLVFQDPARAAMWLRTVLPRAMVRAIDWSSLRPAPAKLIRETLKLDAADLVFAARFRDGRPLWILIEHKSFTTPRIIDQIGRYVIDLRNHSPCADHRPPIPVLTVLVHHGDRPLPPLPQPRFPDLPAGAALSTDDLVAAIEPVFPIVVDDLAGREERELLESDLEPMAKLPLLCLGFLGRYSPEETLAALRRWRELIVAVDRAEHGALGERVLRAIKWYCLASTDAPKEALERTFNEFQGRPDDFIMSTIDREYRRGIALGEARGEAKGEARGEARGEVRGEARGEVKGAAKTLLQLIARRFGPQPPHIEERIRAATADELERFTDRILDVPTIDDLLAAD
ncbi:MAG: Rpn family recombination-promoting nuclease/putative transposase [Planctomycetes bacterium]|nr:Rpn family recombination-promoting nuclease/putative transposase [Planctomycetota bacterium]